MRQGRHAKPALQSGDNSMRLDCNKPMGPAVDWSSEAGPGEVHGTVWMNLERFEKPAASGPPHPPRQALCMLTPNPRNTMNLEIGVCMIYQLGMQTLMQVALPERLRGHPAKVVRKRA
jgi:hypothetical protein